MAWMPIVSKNSYLILLIAQHHDMHHMLCSMLHVLHYWLCKTIMHYVGVTEDRCALISIFSTIIKIILIMLYMYRYVVYTGNMKFINNVIVASGSLLCHYF
jgi:hypothetical protein